MDVTRLEKPAKYDSRTIQDWMKLIEDGNVSLPDFQRSVVWKDANTSSFLQAILTNNPVGTLLILQAHPDQRQFNCRCIKGVRGNPDIAKHLVIDGQQRLTSLWGALTNTSGKRFFIELEDIQAKELKIRKVKPYGRKTRAAERLEDAEKAFEKNLIPVDILYGTDPNPDGDDGLPKHETWCEAVFPNDTSKARGLRIKIDSRLKSPLERYELWHCDLPEETSADSAITIFVKTNESSVKITAFDFAVAYAKQKHTVNFRGEVTEFYEASESAHIRYYFNSSKERWIPELGEWLIKIACLKSGLKLSKKNYEKALDDLYRGGNDERARRVQQLESNLKGALSFAEENGAPTASTLPSVVPIHVIAALQDDLNKLKTDRKQRGRKLLSRYLWRSFFSNRYEQQANDRLFEDFKKLQEDLVGLANGKDPNMDSPIFSKSEVQIFSKEHLIKSVPWLTEKSSLSRAVVSLVLAQDSKPKDWATGEPLTPLRVRELDNKGELHRHHVFPKDFLSGSDMSERADHGLNGVVLKAETNITLSKKDPQIYLKERCDVGRLTEADLKATVEGHLVPYNSLVKLMRPDGGEIPIEDRYQQYIEERANILAVEIKKRTDVEE